MVNAINRCALTLVVKFCEQCPPLAMAVATELKKGVKLEKVTKLEFPIFPIAAAINWDSGIIKQQLKGLEWTKGKNTQHMYLIA